MASRRGPRAFANEVAAAAIGWTLILSWAGKVHWSLLLWIGPGMGLYMAVQGTYLRCLAGRFPLALAAPAAWMLSETLRAALEPPFGFQWMRLGTWWHAVPGVNQGARLFGIGGLGWVVAALAGLVADAARAVAAGRGPGKLALVSGLGPLALALAGAWLVAPGPSVPGPERAAGPARHGAGAQDGASDPFELFGEAVALTRAGLDEARAAGRPPPDLVAWGETMLHAPVIDPALAGAMETGARFAPWSPCGELTADRVRVLDELVRNWVDVGIFGEGREAGAGALEPGTAFVAGAEFWTARAGTVRRANAVFLWERPGRPAGPVAKLHLVPTGETMMGLERYDARAARGRGAWPATCPTCSAPSAASRARSPSARAMAARTPSASRSASTTPSTTRTAARAPRRARLPPGGLQRGLVRALPGSRPDGGLQPAPGHRHRPRRGARHELGRLDRPRPARRGAGPPGRDTARRAARRGTGSRPGRSPSRSRCLPPGERQTPWVRWARAWSWLWILGPILLIAFGRPKQGGA